MKHNKLNDIIDAWNLSDATLRTILKPSSINQNPTKVIIQSIFNCIKQYSLAVLFTKVPAYLHNTVADQLNDFLE